jgi:hypothetical protein
MVHTSATSNGGAENSSPLRIQWTPLSPSCTGTARVSSSPPFACAERRARSSTQAMITHTRIETMSMYQVNGTIAWARSPAESR